MFGWGKSKNKAEKAAQQDQIEPVELPEATSEAVESSLESTQVQTQATIEPHDAQHTDVGVLGAHHYFDLQPQRQ